jgi:quinol monooxygenase YgiN
VNIGRYFTSTKQFNYIIKMNNSNSKSSWLVILTIFILTVTNLTGQVKEDKMNTSITMLVTFNVKPGQKEILKSALLDDAKNARNEKGNITMELYEHKDKPANLYLFERWENQQALDEHFDKPYTKQVLALNKTALSSPMEILYLNDIAPLPGAALKKPVAADTPVDLIVIFTVKDGMQQGFVQQFKKSVQNSRPEEGNIAFHFHSVDGDNTKFVLYERWKSQAALDFHFTQPYTSELFELFKTALAKPVEESLNFVTEIGYAQRSVQ